MGRSLSTINMLFEIPIEINVEKLGRKMICSPVDSRLCALIRLT
jgi:hypothetical protein